MRLAATEKSKGEAGLPRIIRLSRRLKLTEKETDVMMYVLATQVRDFTHNAKKNRKFLFNNAIGFFFVSDLQKGTQCGVH